MLRERGTRVVRPPTTRVASIVATLVVGACGPDITTTDPVPEWAVGSWYAIEEGSSGPRIRQFDVDADGEVATSYVSCGGLDESETLQASGSSDGALFIDAVGASWFGTSLLESIAVEQTNLCDSIQAAEIMISGEEIDTKTFSFGRQCLDQAECPGEAAADWCDLPPDACD